MAVLKKILKWIGIFVGVLFLVVILAAIFGDKETNNKATENTQMPETETTTNLESAESSPPKPDVIDWNVKDPNALTNGNIQLAVKHLKSSTAAPTETLSDAASVLKTPCGRS